ncbi:helix-turn-helix domain-containing protein [Micromonospora wenchangensis]|uniref:helix-turn-helix domain-containing protein n=1 Tax=Micromonospora wenchangensis TaxID=1185415 RepID=UPI0037F3C1C2
MAHLHASPEIDGHRIRELRQQSGLSVTALARRIGITPQYLSQIERGHRPTVSPHTFTQIRAAMGVGDDETLRINLADAA